MIGISLFVTYKNITTDIIFFFFELLLAYRYTSHINIFNIKLF